VQTTGEISEQPVDADLVEPVLIFCIRVLMEIEVQVLVLISESVWMHLQRVMIYGFVNY
jgi:hypothetical protein